ncbi:MAG: hypothetical protein A3H93_02465 [Rhodocyclales bacterium RIFCSPLOWO2_02_FULL_63_24]|nr:MAG: hypothetical protein A2040_18215 [Rhodocyclales bacterium GWA2_65_19]OHC71635.1 MAG: hypothetical protein A3H93_02465 [Rhodocyclales bacterium RIFCSPLOWO2_02_FULL_63_24]
MNHDSTEAFALPADGLAALASPDVQRLAARMAQDAFTRIFRLTLERDDGALQAAVAEIERLGRNWTRAAAGEDARALRLAMLVSGIDQWGLAYCQAFGLTAIPGVTALLGALRGGLDAAADARFQQQFAAIGQVECDAVDFKMELRRSIHMALWHAMIACDDRDEALPILAALGGMLVALIGQMPVVGWRLASEALAHIQLRCLTDAAAVRPLALETTQELFAALRRSLPRERYEPMLAQANQALIAWQQSRRGLH